MNLNNILRKIHQYFSYAIIFFGSLQIFTGFVNIDMIKFLNAEAVHPFHKIYNLIPLIFFATTHALIGIRQKIRLKNLVLDIFFIILGLGIITVIAFYAIKAP
jgi:glucan phosphoethanolaminetransferase (alkaline phosphatase superfamily)